MRLIADAGLFTEVWVADSSPLILLAKVGLLRLVPAMTALLIIPQVVIDEIQDAPPDDPVRLDMADMIQANAVLITTPNIPPELAALRLGKGETAVIAEALQKPYEPMETIALLDDLAARSAAKARGIPLLGTAGILIRSKNDGLISALNPFLHQLQDAGMWASESFYRQIAQSVGEDWP